MNTKPLLKKFFDGELEGLEKEVMENLWAVGKAIDPHGCADEEAYEEPAKRLLEIINAATHTDRD